MKKFMQKFCATLLVCFLVMNLGISKAFAQSEVNYPKTFSTTNAIFLLPNLMKISIKNGVIAAESLNRAGNYENSLLNMQFLDKVTGNIIKEFKSESNNTSDFVNKIQGQPVPKSVMIRIFTSFNEGVGLGDVDSDTSGKLKVNTYGYNFLIDGTTFKLVDTTVHINKAANPQGTTKLVDSPVIFMKNQWGGPSLTITFNLNEGKIQAVKKSDWLGDRSNYFAIKLFHKNSISPYKSYVQTDRYTKNAVAALNNLPLQVGDILAFRSMAVSDRISFTQNGKSYPLPKNHFTYYQFTESGLKPYDTPIHVNEEDLCVLGSKVPTTFTLNGTTLPNAEVRVLINNGHINCIVGHSDGNGKFSIPLNIPKGIYPDTRLTIVVSDYVKSYNFDISKKSMISKKTLSGYEYYLNADLEYLTRPLPNNLVYSWQVFTPAAKKAWDIAEKELLTTTKPYVKRKDGEYEQDVYYKGVDGLTKDDINKILKFLVRNDPRMFHLKDWSGVPIWKNGKIIGQKFVIGNGIDSPQNFHNQLLKIEKGVTNILKYVHEDMDVYQIINVLKSHYESDSRYNNVWPSSDIRGAFITHKIICGGYAKGFEWLMYRMGLESLWVQGYAGGGHAWNYVNLYNNWFLVDSTWGGANWYLQGGHNKFTDGRQIYPDYSKADEPKLAPYRIPFSAAAYPSNQANNLGIVSVDKSELNKITFIYDSSVTPNLNKKVELCSSINNYIPILMKETSKGVWKYTLPITEDMVLGDKDKIRKINFFFRVNDIYNTAGNVVKNNFDMVTLTKGMRNAVTTIKYIDLKDIKATKIKINNHNKLSKLQSYCNTSNDKVHNLSNFLTKKNFVNEIKSKIGEGKKVFKRLINMIDLKIHKFISFL